MDLAREGFVEAMHAGMWIGAAVATIGAIVAFTKLPAHHPAGIHHTEHQPGVDTEQHLVGARNH